MNNKTSGVPGEEIIHPSHYNQGQIEVKDFIRDQKLNFTLGNVVKYVCRAEHKGNQKKDLKKALFYLRDEIESLDV